MSLYDSVHGLSLTIESYTLDGLELQVSPAFLRKTTVVHLHGGGDEGFGEDVTYDAAEHDLQRDRGAILPLHGTWTIASFSEHLGTLPLFDHQPEQHAFLDYRRWAFESAALDLALRQAGELIAPRGGVDQVRRDHRGLIRRKTEFAQRFLSDRLCLAYAQSNGVIAVDVQQLVGHESLSPA